MKLIQQLWKLEVMIGDVLLMAFVYWCITEHPWQGAAFAFVAHGTKGLFNYILTGFPLINGG